MVGPRIVRIEQPETAKPRAKRVRKATGIRLQPLTGQWAAIREGRLIGEYGTGIGGRRLAARQAGTSEVI